MADKENIKYEKVSGIKVAKRKIAPYLLIIYGTLIIWGVLYALFAPGKLAESPEAVHAAEDTGQKIVERHCLNCHATGVAPLLQGIGERMTAEEIEHVIVNGRNSMPSFANYYDETEREAIVTYLQQFE